MEVILCALLLNKHGELDVAYLSVQDYFKFVGDTIERNNSQWTILKLFELEVGPAFQKNAILKHFELNHLIEKTTNNN